jgi:hypothetical protein
VVADIQPVPDVLADAVNREGLAFQRVMTIRGMSFSGN